jgi:hypothetical protein
MFIAGMRVERIHQKDEKGATPSMGDRNQNRSFISRYWHPKMVYLLIDHL